MSMQIGSSFSFDSLASKATGFMEGLLNGNEGKGGSTGVPQSSSSNNKTAAGSSTSKINGEQSRIALLRMEGMGNQACTLA